MRSFRWPNGFQFLAKPRQSVRVCLIVLLLLIASPFHAKERAYRIFDQSDRLPVSWLSGFTQDSNGFFWFGTAAGLYRFDGLEFRHWGKDTIFGWHYQVYAGPDGEVLLTCLPDTTLYRVLPNENAEVVIGPDNKPFANVQSAAFTSDGRLWVARLDALFFRSESGQFELMPREILGDGKIWKVYASADGALWVATTHSIWKVDPDRSYQKILTRSSNGFISNVIAHPDGSLFFMEEYSDNDGQILHWRDGRIIERVPLKANLQALALRGETVWANADNCMVIFRPGHPAEFLEAGRDVPLGGGMLVDREGSLWMGTGREMFQVPEPDTEIFTARDGLPELAPLALHENAEGVWVSTWQGLGHLEGSANWRAYNDHMRHIGEMCGGEEGSLWLFADNHFWERRNGEFIRYPQPAGEWGGCHRASDGSVWMTTSEGLWRTLPGSRSPKLINRPYGYREPGEVFEDSKQRLWITSHEDICQAPSAALRAGQNVQWDCQTIKGSRSIGKPVELADGSLWVGTNMLGVWRYTEAEGWRVIKSSSGLLSQSIAKLVVSPAGGVWILGMTARLRVLPRPDLPGGWEVVEELSYSHGIPSVRIYDLIEETDGSLWVATLNGVAHLPATVRSQKLGAPRVALTDLLINGQRVDAAGTLQIPAGHNQVDLRFAALSFRDRSLLRYQYKLHPQDDWIASSDNMPVFRFYDLSSGKYLVEVRASTDGVNWSSLPAQISFEILSPWYWRWWAIVLFAGLLALILLVVHRLRVRVLLQFERQRMRIAMDLHDEIGSGLGSIGILSSVAASQSVDEKERQEMSKKIAETADELGTSLTDIVWSLRTDTTTLESLAYHLARRANSLFASGPTQFITQFPDDWHSVKPSPPTRRNLLLIAMESLHNAAKHAHAANVSLQFEPAAGHNWSMRIQDDGCGLADATATNGSGMGIQSMKRRAQDIGAEIDFNSNNGHGTIIKLTFNPYAKENSWASHNHVIGKGTLGS
jgi:signal transduction histidine kinase